jgi:autotransporter-associated beta strand protein
VLTLPATGSDGLATKNIVIDTTPPTASAVSTTAAAGSTYGTGGTVPIAVAFSEPVIVNGTPQLTLNDGAVVNYTSGSGTATLTFSYVVVAGQNTTDLDYASTAALALNGGSIQDLAGNAAVLTLPATGSDGLATAGIVIDTATLTVTAADWTSAGLTLMLGGDGNLHVYITGTTTDAVAPCPPASVTCIAIAAPGSTTANLTIDSTAGDPVPAGGLNFCGAGGLIITGSGTVALPSTNTYTGGTTVSSGTLWINAADALPNNGGLTVGAGGTVILDPLSGGPTIATASTMASDASATNAVPSSTGAAASSLILSAPTNVLPSPPGTVRSMVALPKGEGSYGTAYQPITGGLAWVGQAESSADNSDLHHKKAAAILALEAVFAQYGL